MTNVDTQKQNVLICSEIRLTGISPCIRKGGPGGAENKTHEDFRVSAGTPYSYKRSQVIADMALILLLCGI
jgi:hypothetical protein